jgi:AcrR family transcriptional regulator
LARKDPEQRSPGTREKILDAAERLIALHGVEGFQVKDAAEAVGIRPASVYAHFEGRDAIAQAVDARLYAEIVEQVVPTEEGDPEEQLLRMVGNMVRYYAAYPAHLRLSLRDLAQSSFPLEDPPPPSAVYWEKIVEAFSTLVERGVASGQFRKLRPERLQAQLVGAAMASLCWRGWDENGNCVSGVPVDEIVREAQDLMLRLLRNHER